jgi:hypothetical protein
MVAIRAPARVTRSELDLAARRRRSRERRGTRAARMRPSPRTIEPAVSTGAIACGDGSKVELSSTVPYSGCTRSSLVVS